MQRRQSKLHDGDIRAGSLEFIMDPPMPSRQSSYTCSTVRSDSRGSGTFNMRSETPDDLRPRKPAKRAESNESTASRRTQKTRARDFDPETKSTILLACKYYRVLVCTENAFPTDVEQDRFTREAWQLACGEYEVNMTADTEIYAVIRKRGSQVRGQVKHQVQPLVTSLYGFKASDFSWEVDATKALVAQLKYRNSLVYKDYSTRTGLFGTPILLQTLNAQWFSDPHDEGVVFRWYFNPIPLVTMALVFTAIENCIDEWQTGRLRRTDFSEKHYKSVYETHLNNLKGFQAHAQGCAILARLQQQLYDEARMHSRADFVEEVRPMCLTYDDFEAAVREAEMKEGV